MNPVVAIWGPEVADYLDARHAGRDPDSTTEGREAMKPIPTNDPFGGLSERFLTIVDGRIIVKDGRTLEEYINDPRLVTRRKVVPNATEYAVAPYDLLLFGIHNVA